MALYVVAITNAFSESLSLTYERPKDFIVCQWQHDHDQLHHSFLLYRWFHACYFTLTQIYVLVFYDPTDTWCIYLTSWSYMLCVLQSIVGAAIIIAYNNGRKTALEWYKTYWLLHTLALDAAYFVTIMFWTSVYEATDVITPTTIIVHGANVVIMTIDFALVAHPMNLLHCYYVVMFGMTYFIFSMFYYIGGGIGHDGNRYIYKILDWSKPFRVLNVVFATVGLMVANHVYLWAFSKLRKFIHYMITPKKSNTLTK